MIEDRLYLERTKKEMAVTEADLNKLVDVMRRRASFSESRGSLTRYINFFMTLKEFNGHKIIPLRVYKGKLKYPNIILSYTVTGCITADTILNTFDI